MDGTNQGGSQNNSSGQKPSGLSWSQPQQPNSLTPNIPVTPTVPPISAAPAPATPAINPATQQSSTPIITIPHAEKSTTSRTIAVVSGLVIVVAFTAWAIASRNKDEAKEPVIPGTVATTTTPTPTNTSTAGAELHGLTVPSPQDAGSRVTISHIEVTRPTWVVVYENIDGKVGNVLGAAAFSPGVTSGSVELLRNTRAGAAYLVGEAHDDGDGMYSLHQDPAVRDSNGSVSLVQFQTR